MVNALIFLNITWGLNGVGELINAHPLFVHFPIALLLTSPAFYFLGAVLKKEQPFIAGKWALVTGTIAAGFAVWTGLEAAKTVPHEGGVHELMTVHQYFGYGIFGLSVVLSLWVLITKFNLPEKGRILFLVLMVMLGAIVTQGADLGGRMAFQHGVGVGKKSMMQETASHKHGAYSHDEGHAQQQGAGGHDHASA